VDDFDLLEAWRDGDRAAGNMLVRRHFSSVYRFFDTKLRLGVDDITQQTFLGLVEGRDRIADGRSFKAYLFAIARRQLMLALRGRYRAGKVFAPDAVSMQELAGDGMGPSPSRVVAQAHDQRLLVAALRSIPLDFQIVVELHYWEEMNVADIAAVLDVAPGTVKSRLSRARTMLQAKIEELLAAAEHPGFSGGDLGRWVSSLRLAVVPRDDDA
jgi:RNA polymerase sigma-70 factor (ECF subfamily)